jgi:hypothetical protein
MIMDHVMYGERKRKRERGEWRPVRIYSRSNSLNRTKFVMKKGLRSYELGYMSLTLYAGEAARYVGSHALICSNEARKNGEVKKKEKKKKEKKVQ